MIRNLVGVDDVVVKKIKNFIGYSDENICSDYWVFVVRLCV